MSIYDAIANSTRGFNPLRDYAQGYQFGSTIRAQQQQAQANRLAQQQRAQFQQVAPQIMAGDPQAVQTGAAIAPERTEQLLKIRSSLDESRQKKLDEAIETQAQLLDFVESQPEEMRPQAYQMAREEFLRRYPGATAPEAYDPVWSQMAKSQAIPYLEQVKMAEGPELPWYVGRDEQGQLQVDPQYLTMKKQIAEAGKPETTISLGQQLTPGQEALDKEYGKQLAEYEAGGGFADADKMIGQLAEVETLLKESKDITGPLIGKTPDWLLTVTNPQALSAREAVEEVAQRNLRLVLGAQFTEKEGERLIRRAFNPSLSEEENAKRVGRLLNQIKEAHKAKRSAASYFKKHGTLRGWSGEMPTIGDFYEAIEGGQSESKQSEPKTVNWEDL